MWIGAIVSLLAGCWMLWRGLRGRRVGDHPVCRRCGFDLTGLPATSSRCPECGSEITSRRSRRIGVRHRQPRWIVAGLIVLLSAGAAVTSEAVRRVRERGVLHYVPTWLLARQIHPTRYASADVAAELIDRLENHRLSDAQVADLAERTLATMTNPATDEPTMFQAATLVVSAHRAGQLSATDWAVYARLAIDLSMQLRPVVRQDRPLLAYVSACGRNLPSQRFLAYCRMGEVRIDGQKCGVPDGWAAYVDQPVQFAISGQSFTPWDADLWGLDIIPPGQHELSAMLHVQMFTADQPWGSYSNFDPKRAIPATSFDQRIARKFWVYAPPSEWSLVPAGLMTAVRNSLGKPRVIQAIDDGKPQVRVKFEAADDEQAFEFYSGVRASGQSSEPWQIGLAQALNINVGLYTKALILQADLGHAARADVRVWPVAKGYRNTLDEWYLRGWRIDFTGIAVERGP